jgi:hypothetical protein
VVAYRVCDDGDGGGAEATAAQHLDRHRLADHRVVAAVALADVVQEGGQQQFLVRTERAHRLRRQRVGIVGEGDGLVDGPPQVSADRVLVERRQLGERRDDVPLGEGRRSPSQILQRGEGGPAPLPGGEQGEQGGPVALVPRARRSVADDVTLIAVEVNALGSSRRPQRHRQGRGGRRRSGVGGIGEAAPDPPEHAATEAHQRVPSRQEVGPALARQPVAGPERPGEATGRLEGIHAHPGGGTVAQVGVETVVGPAGGGMERVADRQQVSPGGVLVGGLVVCVEAEQ